jgi:hypothetical protein
LVSIVAGGEQTRLTFSLTGPREDGYHPDVSWRCQDPPAMPYGYILLAVTVVLAVRHVRSTYASSRSKCIVAGLAAASLLAPYFWPSFLPLAAVVPLGSMVLQLAVCFYIIFHQTVWRPDDDLAKMSRTPLQKDPSEVPGVDDH